MGKQAGGALARAHVKQQFILHITTPTHLINMGKGSALRRRSTSTRPVAANRKKTHISKHQASQEEPGSLLRFRLEESDDGDSDSKGQKSDSDDDSDTAMAIFKGWKSKSQDHNDLVTALVAGASSSRPTSLSARVDTAVMETNKGLKGKKPARKIAGQKRVAMSMKSKGKGKQRAAAVVSDSFRVQTIVFVPSGIIQADKSHQSKHTFIDPRYMLPKDWRRTCSMTSVYGLVARGLALFNVDEGFEFRKNMSSAEVNMALKTYMPHVFSYLESVQDTHTKDLPYVLCNREKGEIVVMPGIDKPNGDEIRVNSRDTKWGFKGSMTIIASRRPVPKAVLKQWSTHLDSGSDSGSEASTDDDWEAGSRSSDECAEEEEDADVSEKAYYSVDSDASIAGASQVKRRRAGSDSADSSEVPIRRSVKKQKLRVSTSPSDMDADPPATTASPIVNEIIELSSDDGPDDYFVQQSAPTSNTSNSNSTFAASASSPAYKPDYGLLALSISAWSSERTMNDII
ncbi:hypothetical protein K435DRAFT_853866 [Dendrothele bispora CBS 962.96]|uniref:Uncharacterized protein n=1 Tax=Dendrothele bispora (strain CBS 962.96) TaxID=1314807 RepID=A0A4S8MFC2_DENBC|nr:hypothetical protein K435DRAFT_853866 [Dendrothele bispora CBS 962.96]